MDPKRTSRTEDSVSNNRSPTLSEDIKELSNKFKSMRSQFRSSIHEGVEPKTPTLSEDIKELSNKFKSMRSQFRSSIHEGVEPKTPTPPIKIADDAGPPPTHHVRGASPTARAVVTAPPPIENVTEEVATAEKDLRRNNKGDHARYDLRPRT